MDTERWAVEAEARTLRLVADTRKAEVAAEVGAQDQKEAWLRDMEEAVKTTVNRVFVVVEDGLRDERTSILRDDLDAMRLELQAVKAEIKAETLRKATDG